MPDQSKLKNTRSKRPPKSWVNARRISAYQAPPASRVRRIVGWFVNPWTIALALFCVLGAFLTLSYYWFDFSDRIDRRLLSGEVFTPSAGIYSAPKTLRVGENMTRQELVEYLKSAGYIDKNIKADLSRSRYGVDEKGVSIEPGITGIIDGEKVCPSLSVLFAKDGKSVSKILDTGSAGEMPKAQLEPKQLSTIAAEGNGRRKTVTFNDLPPHLIKAVTVTEDRAFFGHYGVNFRGIARALWRRYEGDENTPLSNQGGSSITQQLVKNLLLTNEQTLER
ncbi:MAG: transglycosylase domain-containing protein, partial [Pyrinomonadaceae bacterium]